MNGEEIVGKKKFIPNVVVVIKKKKKNNTYIIQEEKCIQLCALVSEFECAA